MTAPDEFNSFVEACAAELVGRIANAERLGDACRRADINEDPPYQNKSFSYYQTPTVSLPSRADNASFEILNSRH